MYWRKNHATFLYVADQVVVSINLERLLVLDKPQELLSSLLKDFVFYISRADHKKSKPESPTEAWNRVYKRLQSKRK